MANGGAYNVSVAVSYVSIGMQMDVVTAQTRGNLAQYLTGIDIGNLIGGAYSSASPLRATAWVIFSFRLCKQVFRIL